MYLQFRMVVLYDLICNEQNYGQACEFGNHDSIIY